MRKTTYVHFDSQCRKSCGITDIRFGFLDLLEFDDLSDIERYTEESMELEIEIVLHIDATDFRAIQRHHLEASKELISTEKTMSEKNRTN